MLCSIVEVKVCRLGSKLNITNSIYSHNKEQIGTLDTFVGHSNVLSL